MNYLREAFIERFKVTDQKALLLRQRVHILCLAFWLVLERPEVLNNVNTIIEC